MAWARDGTARPFGRDGSPAAASHDLHDRVIYSPHVDSSDDA
jgi:hypothetical protein